MVVAVVTWPVCALLIEIWAPAITAPLESVTVPLIVARPPWANANAFANKNRAIPQRVLYRTRVVIDFPLLVKSSSRLGPARIGVQAVRSRHTPQTLNFDNTVFRGCQ